MYKIHFHFTPIPTERLISKHTDETYFRDGLNFESLYFAGQLFSVLVLDTTCRTSGISWKTCLFDGVM